MERVARLEEELRAKEEAGEGRVRQYEELEHHPERGALACEDEEDARKVRPCGCGQHGFFSTERLSPSKFTTAKRRPIETGRLASAVPLNMESRNLKRPFAPSTDIIPVVNNSKRESLIGLDGKARVIENQRARQLL